MRSVYAGLFSSVDGVVEASNEWQSAFDEEMGATRGRMLDMQDVEVQGTSSGTVIATYRPAR